MCPDTINAAASTLVTHSLILRGQVLIKEPSLDRRMKVISLQVATYFYSIGLGWHFDNFFTETKNWRHPSPCTVAILVTPFDS